MKYFTKRGFLTVPVAIIIAGFIIAVAVIYATGKNNPHPADAGVPNVPSQNNGLGKMENIKPVSAQDHILGNLNAPVKLVEFSDSECPFCKRFHITMKQVMKDYAQSGQVAWVYRHFPLDSLHPKARKEAEATECANALGGNAKFWAYLDRIFEITPSNNGLDPAELPNIAVYVGLDRAKFEQCLSSGTYASVVEAQYQDAIAAGGEGTPYSIVIAPNGKKMEVSGAQPYETVKQTLNTALGLKK